MSDSGPTFSLRRNYAAAPARVYAFFTDPEPMARWFCRTPTWRRPASST